MAVLDASVLIAFAKVHQLELPRQLYSNLFIGPVVYEEVVDAGKRIQASGVERVEHALESGYLRVIHPNVRERRLTARLENSTRLHRGEAEAIAIAKYRDEILVVDDKEARSMAGALGVEFIGTAGVLLEAFLQRYLDFDQLHAALADLSRVIWVSPKVIAAVLKIAREEHR